VARLQKIKIVPLIVKVAHPWYKALARGGILTTKNENAPLIHAKI
jgi:hypothetical protein